MLRTFCTSSCNVCCMLPPPPPEFFPKIKKRSINVLIKFFNPAIDAAAYKNIMYMLYVVCFFLILCFVMYHVLMFRTKLHKMQHTNEGPLQL